MSQPPQNFPPHPEDSPNWGTYHPQPTSPETISDPQRSSEHPGKFTIEDSLSIGWKAFKEHWTTLVGAYVLFLVLVAIVTIALIIITLATGSSYAGNADVAFEIDPQTWAAYGIMAIVSFFFNTALALSSARIIGGQPLGGLKGFFNFTGAGPVLGVTILLSIPGFALLAFLLWGQGGQLPAFLICGLFLIIISIVFYFSVYAAANTPHGVGHALRSSVKVVSNNFGTTIGLLIIILFISFIGGLLLIGTIVATPYISLVATAAYRTAIGAPLKTAYLSH